MWFQSPGAPSAPLGRLCGCLFFSLFFYVSCVSLGAEYEEGWGGRFGFDQFGCSVSSQAEERQRHAMSFLCVLRVCCD